MSNGLTFELFELFTKFQNRCQMPARVCKIHIHIIKEFVVIVSFNSNVTMDTEWTEIPKS